MAKEDKIYMPSGIGGLIRYQEEEEQLIKLKPKQVAYIVTAIVVLELVLRLFVRA